jgi:hypothetical protein
VTFIPYSEYFKYLYVIYEEEFKLNGNALKEYAARREAKK